MLDALTEAANAVDAEFAHTDPILKQDVALKAAAGAMRLASGDLAFRMQTSVAAGTPWSLTDTVAAAEERARVQVAWAKTREAASGAAEPVRAALERVRTAYGDGEPAASRSLFEARSHRRIPGITLQDLRQRNTVEVPASADLARAALDDLVTRAETLAGEARASLVCNATAMLSAILLIGLGFVVLTRGVLRPLLRISATMRALAEGDTAGKIPVDEYRNAFGPIVRAVQVFKGNLIRTRQIESEADESRRVAEEQRRTGMRPMADGSAAAAGPRDIAGRMTETADETAAQSTHVASAAEEAASNVNTVAADLFCGRLFETAPQGRSLFPSDMAEQKKKLMAMLALAVANLDKPEALAAAVGDLGRRHAGYGAKADQYAPVGAAHAVVAGLMRPLTADQAA